MNKKCFRVIFSKTLQRFIVTSKLAKTTGKSNETSGSFGLPDLQLFARIRPLAFSLASGGDGLSESALSGIAAYGSMKISSPVKSTIVSEAIQKVSVLVDEIFKDKKDGRE